MFNKTSQALLLLSLLLYSLLLVETLVKVHQQPYRPLNLSHESDSFKQGAHDGCATAAETYKKNRELFNNDFDYNEGWWAGRRNCEGRSYAEY